MGDGFQAQRMCIQQQLSPRGTARERLKRELIACGRDDLEMPVGAHDAIRELHAVASMSTCAAPLTALRVIDRAAIRATGSRASSGLFIGTAGEAGR